MRHKTGLLGATGFTGSLIGKLLLEKNTEFVPGVRNVALYREIYGKNAPEPLQVDVTDKDSVQRFVNQCDVIINCAGPFNLYAPTVLDTVIKAGNKVYLDITGEQQIVLDSFEQRDAIARKNKVTIVHSVSFESFLADLVAGEYLDKTRKYQEISTYYEVKNGLLSRGTRFTMRLRPFFKTYKVHNGLLVEAKPFEISRRLDLPYLEPDQVAYFVPYPEIIFFYKRFNARNIYSFYFFDDLEGMAFAANQNSSPGDFRKIIELESRRKPKFIPEKFRQREHFYLLLEAIDTNGDRHGYLVEGSDTYGLTARLVVLFVEQIQGLPRVPSGVFSPAQLVDVADVLKRLQTFGLVFEKLKI